MLNSSLTLMPTLLIFFAFLLVACIFGSVRVADQYERAIIFRLGNYAGTMGPGLYLLIPLIEWQRTFDLRTTAAAAEPQEAINRNNIPVEFNAVMWHRIVDPKLSVIAVNNASFLVIQIAATALRNVIGRHTLDDVLTEQEAVSMSLRALIDQVTEPWGV